MKSKNLFDFIACNDHKILDVIYLVECDHDLPALYARLSKLTKDYFAPDERIVILHLDTEYFYHDSPVGFTTHNLFSMIRALGIPLHAFTFITSRPDYDTPIAPFVSSRHDQPEILNPLMHFYTLSVLNNCGVFTTDVHKQIRFHAMSLLGTARSHRVKLYQFMQLHELHHKINYTFLSHSALLDYSDVKPPSGNLPPPVYDLISSHPHRINDGWANFVDDFPQINQLNDIAISPTTNAHLTGLGVDFYNTHAIDIVTETTFDYPCVYVTEKTFRPMLMETPFIMMGPPGTLRYLRSFGLETFGDYWDESYDDILDARQRFLAVTKVIQQVCDQPLSRIKSMCEHMRPKLQHNKNFMLQYINNVTRPLYDKLHRSGSFSVSGL